MNKLNTLIQTLVLGIILLLTATVKLYASVTPNNIDKKNSTTSYCFTSDSFSSFDISGTITDCNEQPLTLLEVDLTGDSAAYSFVSAGGNFSFNNLSSGNYKISPRKANTAASNGLTGLDILLIQQHLLNILPFSDACGLIAADVNEDCDINDTDIQAIRKVILGYAQDLPTSSVWRFLPKDYIFPTGTFPCNSPEMLKYVPLLQNEVNQDFIGIKLGDVN